MAKKIAWLFPGQGAQYPGMGKAFYQEFPTAKEAFQESDDLLGRNLSELIFEGPEEQLTQTKNSQTAIFVTSVAMVRVLQELFPAMAPAMVAGLSLGEYTALHVSGAVPFEQCLPIVQFRGQFMNDACEATKGTMAVILGLNGPEVEELVAALKMPRDLWVANFNCPGQVVVSGTLKGIEAVASAAKERGAKRVLPLQVHGAFHSGLMQLAEERLREHLLNMPLKPGKAQLVMNVSGSVVSDPDTIRHQLIKQVTSPVRWEEGIKAMEAAGVDLFVEIGCGKVLAGFNKRIGVAAPTVSIEEPKDLELLEKALESRSAG